MENHPEPMNAGEGKNDQHSIRQNNSNISDVAEPLFVDYDCDLHSPQGEEEAETSKCEVKDEANRFVDVVTELHLCVNDEPENKHDNGLYFGDKKAVNGQHEIDNDTDRVLENNTDARPRNDDKLQNNLPQLYHEETERREQDQWINRENNDCLQVLTESQSFECGGISDGLQRRNHEEIGSTKCNINPGGISGPGGGHQSRICDKGQYNSQQLDNEGTESAEKCNGISQEDCNAFHNVTGFQFRKYGAGLNNSQELNNAKGQNVKSEKNSEVKSDPGKSVQPEINNEIASDPGALEDCPQQSGNADSRINLHDIREEIDGKGNYVDATAPKYLQEQAVAVQCDESGSDQPTIVEPGISIPVGKSESTVSDGESYGNESCGISVQPEDEMSSFDERIQFSVNDYMRKFAESTNRGKKFRYRVILNKFF